MYGFAAKFPELNVNLMAIPEICPSCSQIQNNL